MKKGLKFTIMGVVVVAAIVYLFASGFSSDSVYYLEVSEVIKHPEKFNNKGMRVSGAVVDSTVDKRTQDKYLAFDLEDESGTRMRVEYNGLIPDTFKEDIHVIVEGKYDTEKKIFMASTLLTKCPSKYEAEVEEKK